jgi:nicotinate-nucleotide adenylyltransferase
MGRDGGPRIGLLGGTFDPVHFGHLRVAEEARERLALEQILFLPAPQPWRKAGRRITPVEHRLAMVRLAVAANPAFAVSTVELEQQGPTYTAETLAALHAELGPGATLYFILGTDALRDLPHWYRPERIVALARLAVVVRPGRRMPDLSEFETRVPGLSAAIERVETTRLEVSSTALRRLLAEGRSARYLVPDPVLAYIEEHVLYRRPSAIDQARQ